MRVSGAGARWQENRQNEKQQQLPEAYTLRADARHASRLTPEPSALAVAGLLPSSRYASVYHLSLLSPFRSRFTFIASSFAYLVRFSSYIVCTVLYKHL